MTTKKTNFIIEIQSQNIFKTGVFNGTYMNGKKHGLWTENYTTDELATSTMWSNGKRNGKNFVWYVDGTIAIESTYVNDQLHGERKGFSCEKWGCNMILYECYLNGKMNGTFIYYSNDGLPITLINYVNDKNMEIKLYTFQREKFFIKKYMLMEKKLIEFPTII